MSRRLKQKPVLPYSSITIRKQKKTEEEEEGEKEEKNKLLGVNYTCAYTNKDYPHYRKNINERCTHSILVYLGVAGSSLVERFKANGSNSIFVTGGLLMI